MQLHQPFGFRLNNDVAECARCILYLESGFAEQRSRCGQRCNPRAVNHQSERRAVKEAAPLTGSGQLQGSPSQSGPECAGLFGASGIKWHDAKTQSIAFLEQWKRQRMGAAHDAATSAV